MKKAPSPWICLKCEKPLKELSPFAIPVGEATLATVACVACGPTVPPEELLGAIQALTESWPGEAPPAPKKKRGRAEPKDDEIPPSRYEVARQALEYWKSEGKPGETPDQSWARRRDEIRKAEVEKRKKERGGREKKNST